MGEKLDLFSATASTRRDAALPASAIPDDALSVVVGGEAPTDAGGQMDLFGDRWLRAAAAHKALEMFDLEAASTA